MRTELLLIATLSLVACKKDEAAPPAPPPQAKPAAPAPAAPAEEKTWTVNLEVAPPLAAGKEAIATITIAARDGFHVNPDYPLSFKPAASETVTFSGDRVQLTASEKTPCKDHADDNCEVKVPLAFTPKQAGVASFEGVLSFSVCSEEKCLTPKETLTMKVDVQ